MTRFPVYILYILAFLTISACGLFSPMPVYAASDRGGLKSLTLSDGLSDLLVNVIYKDSKGFIWFGTESGADRFDGNRILRFPLELSTSGSRRVQAICESESGVLFIGNAQGLFALRPGKSIPERINPSKLDFSVNALYSAGNTLYIGSRYGLFIYDEKSGKLTQKLLSADNLSSENQIYGIQPDGKTALWLLTSRKLWLYGIGDQSFKAFDIPVDASATRLSEINGQLYIGTDGDGVVPFDISSRKFNAAFKLGNGIVTSLSATPGGNLMIATDGEGIYEYSPSQHKEIKHLTSGDESELRLKANSVYSTLIDDLGILWVGYYQSGVDYKPRNNESVSVHILPGGKSTAGMNVRSFAYHDRYGLLGTHDGLYLENFESHSMRHISKPQIDSNLIFSVIYWRGNFYAGTYHGGLYRVDPTTGDTRRFGPKELNNATIFEMAIDKSGQLWAATSIGLYVFSSDSDTPKAVYTPSNSQLPDMMVFEIFFDSLGRGWIGTEKGMAIWNGSSIQTSGFPKKFINNSKIRVIYEDRDHNLYFAPDRGEIWTSKIDMSDAKPIPLGVDGRFTQIASIVEDPEGWLWLGTDKGLIRYDKKGKFMVVNNVNGNGNPVYTLCQSVVDKNGDLWFGSTTGLHHLDLSLFKNKVANAVNNKLTVTEIQSNGKSISDRLEEKNNRSEIKLSSKENDLIVNVSDFGYTEGEYFEIEYILEGYDKNWHSSIGISPIVYHDLPPGDYTLKIRKPGDPESEISIAVKKGGNALMWLLVMLLLLAIIISALFLIMQKRRHRRELEMLNYSKEVDQAQTANIEKKEESGDDIDEQKTPYRFTRLSEEECKRLLKQLNIIMKENKPFINPDLKINDLAKMIDSSQTALSFLFNQYLKKSYYDYINEWRINEFKNLVKDKEMRKYTLNSLAEKCGFTSRATFFRHFKNLTGMTPSEYLKQN